MKRIVAVAAVMFAFAAVAVDAPKNPIVLDAKQGKVTFNHSKHAAAKCETCHVGQATPGKIGKMEKDAAHKLCQECHKTGGKGPTKCAECHKK
jgi:hypothetical protein